MYRLVGLRSAVLVLLVLGLMFAVDITHKFVCVCVRVFV